MSKASSKVRSAAEKTAKKYPLAALIAVIAVILVIAISIAVIYFAFPETWNKLISLVLGEPLAKGDGVLTVCFVDVGQGDCIYIEFPDGSDMVIDCGSSKGSSEKEAIAAIDKLNADDTIDHLMLTHTDSDHVGYLDAVIDKYDVRNIYMPNILAVSDKDQLKNYIAELDSKKLSMFTDPDVVSTDVYAEFFISALSEPNCTIHLNMDPDEHTNGIIIATDTYRLTFYCPTEEYYAQKGLGDAEALNAISPVGILEYNGRRIVFTGDSNSKNEPLIAQRIGYIDCDVLKVAHHGSATSSLDEFLDAVNCEYAVISCGLKHGHPTMETLARLSARSMTLYRTDNNGTVTLTVDKDGAIKFSTQKNVSQEINYLPAD